MHLLSRLFGAAVAAAILLAASNAASGAMWLRITVDPSEPVTGEPARVAVVTLANFGSGCVTDPTADLRSWWDWNGDGGKDLRFDLNAFQGDRVLDIPLARREGDVAYWDGTVTFPSPGVWTVRMVYPLWAGGTPSGEECAGSRITVTVRSTDGLLATSSVAQPLGAGAMLLVAFAALALAFRPRWRRASAAARPARRCLSLRSVVAICKRGRDRQTPSDPRPPAAHPTA